MANIKAQPCQRSMFLLFPEVTFDPDDFLRISSGKLLLLPAHICSQGLDESSTAGWGAKTFPPRATYRKYQADRTTLISLHFIILNGGEVMLESKE